MLNEGKKFNDAESAVILKAVKNKYRQTTNKPFSPDLFDFLIKKTESMFPMSKVKGEEERLLSRQKKLVRAKSADSLNGMISNTLYLIYGEQFSESFMEDLKFVEDDPHRKYTKSTYANIKDERVVGTIVERADAIIRAIRRGYEANKPDLDKSDLDFLLGRIKPLVERRKEKFGKCLLRLLDEAIEKEKFGSEEIFMRELGKMEEDENKYSVEKDLTEWITGKDVPSVEATDNIKILMNLGKDRYDSTRISRLRNPALKEKLGPSKIGYRNPPRADIPTISELDKTKEFEIFIKKLLLHCGIRQRQFAINSGYQAGSSTKLLRTFNIESSPITDERRKEIKSAAKVKEIGGDSLSEMVDRHILEENEKRAELKGIPLSEFMKIKAYGFHKKDNPGKHTNKALQTGDENGSRSK